VAGLLERGIARLLLCGWGASRSISTSKISGRLQGEDAPVTRAGIY
jgi:hypothetical protein